MGTYGHQNGCVRVCAPAVLFALWFATLSVAQVADPGAESILALALRSKHMGQRAEALALVNGLIAAKPDFPDALWLRAWLHAEADRKAEAAADFGRLLRLEPHGGRAGQARQALGRLGYPVPAEPPAPPAPTVAPAVKPPAPTPAPAPVPEPAASPKPTAAPPSPDLDRLFLEAELKFRARRYTEAAAKFEAVVRADPGYRTGMACGKLGRALFLSGDSARALAILEPLREHWAADPYTCHQVALCTYAIQEARGLPTNCVPDCVWRAFNAEEPEYPKSAPEMRRAAASVFAGRRDDYSRAKAAFDFVRGHVYYDSSLIPLGRQSVLFTLKTGRGVCTSFAQLFVALCRTGGVPARLVSGTCRTGFHNWGEVWLVGHGWVPADPTRGRSTGVSFGQLNGDVRRAQSQRENW